MSGLSLSHTTFLFVALLGFIVAVNFSVFPIVIVVSLLFKLTLSTFTVSEILIPIVYVYFMLSVAAYIV